MRFVDGVDQGRSLGRAARDADFGSYVQCHRVFRRILGCSPTEYFAGSRAATDPGNGGIGRGAVTEVVINKVRKLNDLAQQRGQTMGQLALAWVLKDPRVTSVLIGASSPEQVKQNVGCINNLVFSPAELETIDRICAG
jgi:aryl-alcohol dehydrogenase-like predicted oxidoreductase